jgi:hypothetical protein
MAHDVFISYSSKDKPISDGICANLEAAGIRCWIAPRDIQPGEDWPKAITTAISNSKVMVLVFSASSNSSDDVSREIILAANHKLVIIPFKIENIEPEPGKQYYLARTHWLEAMNPPTLEQIQTLVETVRSVLPIVIPEGIIQAKPVGRPPAGLPHAAMKSPSRPWYLWVIDRHFSRNCHSTTHPDQPAYCHRHGNPGSFRHPHYRHSHRFCKVG